MIKKKVDVLVDIKFRKLMPGFKQTGSIVHNWLTKYLLKYGYAPFKNTLEV